MHISIANAFMAVSALAGLTASSPAAKPKPQPPFRVVAKVYSTSDCSTPLGTAVQTLNVTGDCSLGTALFPFQGIRITVPKAVRAQASNYTMVYYNGPECSTPNRQGIVEGPVPKTNECFDVGSNFGVAQSVTFDFTGPPT